jgi:hypothetical protein
MSSIRRIIASRANGARSRGPVTESGKLISSQNARRHALLARIIVLKDESPEGFAEVLADHLQRFQPTDGVEFGVIEEMVAAWWRMRRAWSIETQLFTECFDDSNLGDGASRLAATFKNVDDARGLALLHRYETRLHGIYQRGLRNLQLLRTSLLPNEPSPISEQSSPAPEPPPEPAPAPEPVPEPLVPQPLLPQPVVLQPVAQQSVAQQSVAPQSLVLHSLVLHSLVAQAFSLRCRHSWRHSPVSPVRVKTSRPLLYWNYR